MRVTHFKAAAMKAAVVLVPSYLAAYFSDKMVWVVPTLTASSFFAATIGVKEDQIARRTEEDMGQHEVHGAEIETDGHAVDAESI